MSFFHKGQNKYKEMELIPPELHSLPSLNTITPSLAEITTSPEIFHFRVVESHSWHVAHYLLTTLQGDLSKCVTTFQVPIKQKPPFLIIFSLIFININIIVLIGM